MNAVFVVFQLFLIMLVVLTLLFCFLIVRKYRFNRFEEKKEYWKKQYLNMLLDALKGNREIPPPESKAMREALEDVLTRYYSLMKGNTLMMAEIETIAERYFYSHYQNELVSSSWSTRMNTLYRIEKFRMASLATECLAIYESKYATELEAIQVFRILANVQDDRIYTILLKEKKEYSGFYYLDIFSRLERPLFEQFVESIDQFPLLIQQTLIEAMGERKEYEYLPYVEAFLGSSVAEFRIRALKALSKMGYVSKVDKIIPSLTSDSWQERMMAAKAAKLQREDRLNHFLLRLLSDKEWWVRTAAAESLSYQSKGRTLLKEVSETHEDRFARDIAHEWLLRKEYTRDPR
ncbi:HEAT repeat domain-containing protein [Guptibacillus algicola]|uniref:HEAT repeat domain-containing protein n=1 Tax=Guptibacillus algicola TaxID=225844 RepID=UPI001CD666B7|nr:HEAT repeat domain-containing protein [Alkalihalobacillus algicola]MCA0988603.1 HEAT repeat domain-containing protein [Alkalihalobacillus algicola]